MKIHGMCNAGPLILGLIVAALPACQKSADSVRVGGSTFPAPPAEGTASIFGSACPNEAGELAADCEYGFQPVSYDSRHTGAITVNVRNRLSAIIT